MKKMGILILCLLVISLITGCGTSQKGEQKLVCTTTENDEEMITKEVISMIYKNDKLKRMTMEVTTKITDSEVQEQWDDFKASMDNNNEEFNEDGMALTVDVNDEEYEYKTILDIDVENATEEKLKEQGFEGIKDDNSTLEESKKAAEEDGAVCVIE